MKEFKFEIVSIQKLVFLLIVILGVIYIRFTWIRFADNQNENILQIARSIEASLPKADLKALEAKPEDIDKPQYKLIKSFLKEIIRVNPNARFAYIYTEQNNKIYFIADSEPEGSVDYSPPGQEYTEAKFEDKQPFKDGNERITAPLPDRWGTWKSVLVPIKDEASGKVIAVFGMDFNAKSFNDLILFEVLESSVLIFLILLTFIFLFRIQTKNKMLRADLIIREQAEEHLRQSEEKYRLLTEFASDVIWVLNTTKSKYTYISPSIFQLRGFTVEEAMNEVLNESFTAESNEIFQSGIRNNIQEFIQNPENTYFYIIEIQQPCKNGEVVWVEMSIKFRYNANREIEIVGVSRNIEERKKMENEIRKREYKMRELNAEKDKYFSIIAHDLRSPFNSFLGLTQIMAEELSSLTMDEIQKFALSMKNSATNLFRLLENLLEWAQIQQGLIPFSPDVIQLLPNVNESIEMILESASSKGIRITYNVPNDLKVFADFNILQTIIRNLVSNAVKFTPKGGGVFISAKKVHENFIEISIKDTGIGMNKEMMDHLFQLDVNTSRKGTEGESSSGLGLIICKDFIEKHGGKLWLESEEGVGSTFYFTLAMTEENS